MARLTIMKLGDTSVPTDDFSVDFEAGQLGAWGIDLAVRARQANTAAADGYSRQPRDNGFVCWSDDPTQTIDDFREAVMAALPADGSPLTLTARTDPDDSSTEMTIEVYVISIKPESHQRVIRGTWRALNPAWQSATAQTATTSPATNNGTMTVPVVVSVSLETANGTRRRATITDRTGQGIANYPVRIGYTASLDPANIIVISRGLSVPFRYDATSGALWVRANINPSQSLGVDIYHSTAITNAVTADALDLAGLDLVSATNTLPAWDDWAVSRHPQAAAIAWMPVNLPDQIAALQASDWPWTYSLIAQDSDSVTFEVRAQAQPLANDWNGVLLTLPVPLASGATIAVDMTYTTWSLSMEAARNVTRNLLGRTRDNAPWELIASDRPTSSMVTANTTYDWDLAATDVSGYMQLALAFGTQIAIIGDNQPSAVFEISSITLSTGLDSAKTPSVSLSDSVNACVIDAILTNSTTGDRIELDGLLMDDTTLVIDPVNGTIDTTTGPWYVDNLQFTEAAQLFRLKPGANSWTCDDAVISLSWHDARLF